MFGSWVLRTDRLTDEVLHLCHIDPELYQWQQTGWGKKHNHPQSSRYPDRLGQTWHCRCHRHKAFPRCESACVASVCMCLDWHRSMLGTGKDVHLQQTTLSLWLQVTIYIQRYKRLPAQDDTQKPVTTLSQSRSQSTKQLSTIQTFCHYTIHSGPLH